MIFILYDNPSKPNVEYSWAMLSTSLKGLNITPTAKSTNHPLKPKKPLGFLMFLA